MSACAYGTAAGEPCDLPATVAVGAAILCEPHADGYIAWLRENPAGGCCGREWDGCTGDVAYLLAKIDGSQRLPLCPACAARVLAEGERMGERAALDGMTELSPVASP